MGTEEQQDVLGLDDDMVAEASLSGSKNYVKAGAHTFLINSAKPKVTRKGAKAVILELKTITSTVHKTGEVVSRFIDVHPEKGLGEYKSVIAAVFGVDFDEVEGKHIRQGYSEDQPLAGQLIECSANDGKTAKGNEFTYCTWTHKADQKANA